jgi:hypothetical protein
MFYMDLARLKYHMPDVGDVFFRPSGLIPMDSAIWKRHPIVNRPKPPVSIQTGRERRWEWLRAPPPTGIRPRPITAGKTRAR